MNELLIKQNKGALKTLPVMFLLVFTFFTISSYLGSGFSAQTQAMLAFTIFFTVFALWFLHIHSKRQVLINKSTEQIEITEFSIFGTQKYKNYPLGNFSSIRSYITHGKGARNIVELVTSDGNRGLFLSSFLPCGGKNFWSLEIETENPEAALLASQVAAFLSIKNIGFIGHKFATNQVGIENNAKFISNMF
ncbi:hypothetical protein [Methylophilus sp. 14]|uniref:hypothetical protein n=1 Tax=Methylophilus sp. 14 TaxID=2781019 RepID=UPI00188FC270|nr:hypothetical protein [Methylophilus sp. 14]MBF4988343.1 hypothetical protein [Methylophilus sp. 14]